MMIQQSPVSSPHTLGNSRTTMLMLEVLGALSIGLIAGIYFFGWGYLINLVWLSLAGLVLESLVLKLRSKPVIFHLSDCSALVTAALLALTIPPYCPWWVSLVGVFFAIVIAKQLYGGIGFNPFNPAMVGYVVILISYPVQMTQWPLPTAETSMLSMASCIEIIFGASALPDGTTGATVLDLLKQNGSLTMEQLSTTTTVINSASFAVEGVEWMNVGFLVGGAYLLYRRIFTWHAPFAMLTTLLFLSALGYDSGSSESLGSPLLHLFSGATMLGAFFILTDPVSGCTSPRGKILFGIGAGAIVFIIRAWGNYPDGVAFAVLLMNFAAPFIDYFTQPRIYGHTNPTNVRIKRDS